MCCLVTKLVVVTVFVLCILLIMSIANWRNRVCENIDHSTIKVKIKYKEWKSYWLLNPDKYGLHTGGPYRKVPHVGCSPKEYAIIFGYIDYYRYRIFRSRALRYRKRQHQNELNRDFLEVVQRDIDRTRKIAEEEVNKAKELVNGTQSITK